MARRGRPDVAQVLGAVGEKPSEHFDVAYATLKCSFAHRRLMMALPQDPVAMASLRVAVLHTCGYQKRDAFHPSVPHDRAA